MCVNALQDTDFRCLAANVRHVTPRLPPLTWCKKPKGLYPRVSFTLCLSPTMTPFPTGTASLQALVSNCRRIFVKSPRHGRPALSVRLLPALHRCRAAPLARTDTQALATSPGPLVAPQRRSVAHPVDPASDAKRWANLALIFPWMLLWQVPPLAHNTTRCSTTRPRRTATRSSRSRAPCCSSCSSPLACGTASAPQNPPPPRSRTSSSASRSSRLASRPQKRAMPQSS